ncbi:MAG: hypothetical protein HYW52_07870 [Gemmatimonadetes bacterium]|nr:hypothetical protein [Gemmatimonadota bacterium]
MVIAHRGASGYEHENSLAAFRAAVRIGADGIELDIHDTADGAIIVHHDPLVDGRPIRELPGALVSRHRLPNGEPVPTLGQALGRPHPTTTYTASITALCGGSPRNGEAWWAACCPRPIRWTRGVSCPTWRPRSCGRKRR